jgi:hypothetical protein
MIFSCTIRLVVLAVLAIGVACKWIGLFLDFRCVRMPAR